MTAGGGTATFRRDPKHGYDPWLGPRAMEAHDLGAFHPALLAAAAVPAVHLFNGEDTISGDIGLLTGGLDMYASYVDNFGGFGELAARFPVSHHPAGLPVGYASASNMGAVIANAGNRPFWRWSAHFGQGKHICGPHTCGFPQAHMTQWDDHGPHGENADRTVMSVMPAGPGPWLLSITIFGNAAQCADMELGAMRADEFGRWYDTKALRGPVGPPPPPPPPPEDAMGIAVGKNDNGKLQLFVEKTDGTVSHIGQDKPDGDWWKNPDGSFRWVSLGKP